MEKKNKERQNISANATKEPFVNTKNNLAESSRPVATRSEQNEIRDKSLTVKEHLLPAKKSGGQDDTVQYITIAKGQTFDGKIIATDHELNRYAENQMGITVSRNWNPKYTNEEVRDIVSNGKTIAYRFNANDVNKSMELLQPEKKGFVENLDGMTSTIQKVRILDLLSQLSPQDIADYRSKNNIESANAAAVEASLRDYIQQKNERLQKKILSNRQKGELKGKDISSLYKQNKKEYTTSATVKKIPAPSSAELAGILEWQNVRSNFLNEWTELDFLNFSPELHDLLEKVTDSIKKSFTANDIAAVIKEKRSKKTTGISGILYSLLQEHTATQSSMKKAITELKKHLNSDIPDYGKYKTLITDLINLKDKMSEIIKVE